MVADRAVICQSATAGRNEGFRGRSRLTLNLRAERANTTEDRIYTITVATSDASGNTTFTTVTVTVHQP